jgi:hypothetical protein
VERNRNGADLEIAAGITISSPKFSTWSPEMEDDAHRRFADEDIEILPPESCRRGQVVSPCGCCGRPAALDDDCYGICEECLSP